MAEKPLPAYEGDEPYVFVSYSHEDELLVYPEIRWLQDQGVNVWYDAGISGASRWRDAIAGRLGASRLILFFVSPGSVVSPVCREEIEYALDLGRPVLSVHLKHTELPEGIRLALANRQALFRQDLDVGEYERKLLAAIGTQLDTRLAPTGRRRGRWRLPGWLPLAAAAVGSGIAAAVVTWTVTGPDTPRPVTRFTLDLPPEIRLTQHLNVAISPDGQFVVFNATAAGADATDERLYMRRLDNLDVVPVRLPEPINARAYSMLALSPDGGSVAYVSGTTFKKTRLQDGATVTLAERVVVPTSPGATWGDNGIIAVGSARATGIVALPETGGATSQVAMNPNAIHMHPSFVPGGKGLVYVLWDYAWQDPEVAYLSLDTGESKRLVPRAMFPRVTASGHLVFLRERALWAARFDAEAGELSSDPVRVVEDIRLVPGEAGGSIDYDISATGTLVYASHQGVEAEGELVLVDRTGKEEPFGAPLGHYYHPRMSPDGSRVALIDGIEYATGVLSVYSPSRRLLEPFDYRGDFIHVMPLWHPGGEMLAFGTFPKGQLLVRGVNAMGDVRELTPKDQIAPRYPTSWSGDGTDLVYYRVAEEEGTAIGTLTWSQASPTLNEPLELGSHASVSPDGKWIAFASRGEVYVASFPDMQGSRDRVSTQGGSYPLWSHDGSEISFLSPAGMAAAPVATEPALDIGTPEVLFDLTPYPFSPGRNHDVAPEGRFLMIRSEPDKATKIVVVQNWVEELERLLPED